MLRSRVGSEIGIRDRFELDEIPSDEDPEDTLDPETKHPYNTDTPSQK